MGQPVDLILTCAGKSTRFPNRRPKWSLTHPDGELMAYASASGISGVSRKVAAFNSGDIARFGKDSIERAMRGEFEIVDVGNTKSPVETLVAAINAARIAGAFVAKDCDNYFEVEVSPANAVAVSDLSSVGKVDPSNKSYVDAQAGAVYGISDRGVIGRFFCCGAYSFADAGKFLEIARAGAATVPLLIERAMGGGENFAATETAGYLDWGTSREWDSFVASFKTLFVDVDGVLVKSAHRSFRPRWGESEIIQENVDYLKSLDPARVEIVLTTSRPEELRGATAKQLDEIPYSRLLMGFRNCARYIVNDYPTHSDGTCFAINLKRDAGELEGKME